MQCTCGGGLCLWCMQHVQQHGGSSRTSPRLCYFTLLCWLARASSVQTRQFGSDGACFLQLCLGVGDRFPGVSCRVEIMCQRLAGSLFLRLRCWLVLLLVVLITPLLPLFFSYRQPCASGRNVLWAVRYFPQILESQTLKKISGCHRTHTKN